MLYSHHFLQRNSDLLLDFLDDNSATGIKQTFYFKYAEYLSDQGFDVITFDFRGIGMSKRSSLKGLEASMVDWAAKDYSAVTQYIIDHFSNYQKILIGHSFGGNSLGLSPMANSYDAYVTIAAPYAYWKYFDKSYQPAMLWAFYIVIPFFTALFGYFPSNVKQLGENLQKGVARDWKSFITHPDSMLEVANRNSNYYDTIDKKMLMISFSDDKMSSGKAVDVLANRAYPNADVERMYIEADESAPVGHLRFFKERFKDDLWPVPLQWIDELELRK